MRTVNFETLLRETWQLCSGVNELPGTDDFPVLMGCLDLALQEIWELEMWPDLVADEERQLRSSYDNNETYEAPSEDSPNEVFFPQTRKYYQNLRNLTGVKPADSNGVTSDFWALCKASYSGPDHAEGVAYTVGKVVRNPVNDRFYQCHAEHTSGATLDDTKFGILTPFDPYIAWEQTINDVEQTKIGEVALVTTANTRITQVYREIRFALSANGIQILEPVGKVWVKFRRRRPELAGEAFNEAANYTTEEQVYFSPTSAGAKGNLYRCVIPSGITEAGRSPQSNPELWELVQIPMAFKGFLIWSAYAKWLPTDGQMDKVSGAEAMAQKYLAIEVKKAFELQDQLVPMRLRVH